MLFVGSEVQTYIKSPATVTAALQIVFEKGMQFCVFLVSKNYIITSAGKIWINQDARLGLEPCELLQGLYHGL